MLNINDQHELNNMLTRSQMIQTLSVGEVVTCAEGKYI